MRSTNIWAIITVLSPWTLLRLTGLIYIRGTKYRRVFTVNGEHLNNPIRSSNRLPAQIATSLHIRGCSGIRMNRSAQDDPVLISFDAARCSAWRPRSSARTGMQLIFASDTGDREGCGVGMRRGTVVRGRMLHDSTIPLYQLIDM